MFEKFYTTPLVKHVMSQCARELGVDADNAGIADALYWACCDLEDWDEDHGFGSSDLSGYINYAEQSLKDQGLMG